MLPSPDQLTSHQAPALLVATILEAAEDRGSSRLLPLPAADLLTCIEGAAQTVACVQGAHLRRVGGPPASGMLVGVKDAQLETPIEPWADITIRVVRMLDLPPFQVWQATFTIADTVIGGVELKTVRT